MALGPGATARERIALELDRMRTGARVLGKTGLGRALRWPGVRAALASLGRGHVNPASALRLHAKNSPERVALLARGRAYRYGELDALVDRLGAALRRGGVGRREPVAVMVKNRPEFLALQYALGRLGAAAVNVSWRSTPDELGHVLADSGARWLFADADARAAAEAVAPRLEPGRLVVVGGDPGRFVAFDELAEAGAGGAIDDDPEGGSLVMYTSGTTGRPKGAVRTFPRDALTQTLRFLEAAPLHHDDVHYAACPLYHATAYGFANFTFLLGGRVVLGEEFSPLGFDEAVRRHGVTNAALVPTMLYRLVEAARRGELPSPRPRSLRAIFVGGAALTPALASAALEAFGDVLYQFYGATETGLVTFATPEDLRLAPGTIGRALRGNDIRLLDEAGAPVADGEVGELFVRSPLAFDAYHNNEAATSAATRAGYFSVGDLARRDAAGRYFLSGRKRELIISGGVNVYPAEVEAALAEHPDVADAAVVGVPDDEWGERVRAYVVAREGRSPEAADLVAHCRARLAGPKVPREVVFLEALPRNPTGKVVKRALAELGARPAPRPGGPASGGAG
ncbi:MAG TPA: AMP-binding protein [Polyangiaceae bacterium]|nr:AMP-binding protein [Polyangiaceae bacterium]